MFVKVVPNQTYYLDIGNSTIKVSDDQFNIQIFDISKINETLNELKNNKVYAFSSNLDNNIKLVLKNFKENNSTFFIFENKHISHEIKSRNIDNEIVGVDILFGIYYLNKFRSNYLLINFGTFLVSYLVLNKKLVSVNIDIGVNKRVISALKSLNINLKDLWSWNGNNTINAIKSSILLQIYGIYHFYKRANKKLSVLISGNDLSFEFLNAIKEKIAFEEEKHIELKGLIQFIKDNKKDL